MLFPAVPTWSISTIIISARRKRAKLRQQLKIDANKKVITYLGSVGGWYMTKEMFGFVSCLLRRYPEFVMLVLTRDEPAWVKAEAIQQGIPEDKLIITTAPREKMPLYISLSDCSIFFIRPTYSKKASSPTKHAELMGMGVPVICNDIGDTGHIIEQTKTGVMISEFTETEYEKQVQKMDTGTGDPQRVYPANSLSILRFEIRRGQLPPGI